MGSESIWPLPFLLLSNIFVIWCFQESVLNLGEVISSFFRTETSTSSLMCFGGPCINSGLFASRMSKLKSFVRFLLFMISFAAIKRWWILCNSSGELSSFMALQTTGFFLRESASVVSLFYALLLSKMEMCLSLFHLSFWKVCIILKARSDFIYLTPKYFFISPECNFIDFLIFLATLVTDFSSSAVSSILLPCKVGLLYFNYVLL